MAGDPDEVAANNLDVRLFVNGEQKQCSNTHQLIFGIGEIIEYLSAGLTLDPGDVIFTGTPAGVGGGSQTAGVAEGRRHCPRGDQRPRRAGEPDRGGAGVSASCHLDWSEADRRDLMTRRGCRFAKQARHQNAQVPPLRLRLRSG